MQWWSLHHLQHHFMYLLTWTIPTAKWESPPPFPCYVSEYINPRTAMVFLLQMKGTITGRKLCWLRFALSEINQNYSMEEYYFTTGKITASTMFATAMASFCHLQLYDQWNMYISSSSFQLYLFRPIRPLFLEESLTGSLKNRTIPFQLNTRFPKNPVDCSRNRSGSNSILFKEQHVTDARVYIFESIEQFSEHFIAFCSA